MQRTTVAASTATVVRVPCRNPASDLAGYLARQSTPWPEPLSPDNLPTIHVLTYHRYMATAHLVPDDQSRPTPDRQHHGRITIHDGPVERVGESHRSTIAPASHFLHEWRTYTVRCSGAMRLELGSQSYTAIVEVLFQVQFENQIGLTHIRAFDVAGKTLDTRHVEVMSAKLGGPNASLAFLRTILADLTSERGAMAFLPRATTSRTVQQVQGPPALLVQYFFLLNNAEDIEEALQYVLHSPHRILDDEMEHVSIFDVTEVDADVVLQLVQGDAQFDQSVSPPRLNAAPSGVWFRVPREGYDSAENQFVKAAAAAMADACEDVLGASWLGNIDDPSVAHRRETLSKLGSQLRRFIRAPMFDEVGPMQRVPVSSRVLHRRPGYRDLNLHWQAFLTSQDPVWQRMQRAIGLRDIATLYEYWIWFALCREIHDVYASERPEVSAIPPSDLGLPHGLRARFKGPGTLTYNASRRAYSGIWLRPDYL